MKQDRIALPDQLMKQSRNRRDVPANVDVRSAHDGTATGQPPSDAALLSEALDALPADLRTFHSVQALDGTGTTNVVALLHYERDKKVLKIFPPSSSGSPLLPNASKCAQKEAWIASNPRLTQYIPHLYFSGPLGGKLFESSFIVQALIEECTASTMVKTVHDAEQFSVQLGVACRDFHGVPTTGYGALLRPDGLSFTLPTWNDYIRQRITLSKLDQLVDREPNLWQIFATLQDRLEKDLAIVHPTLFHHDLLHNWSNVFVSEQTLQVRAAIDWDQCGSGHGLVVDLGVARFALNQRSLGSFGWPQFLQCFLRGYGIRPSTYQKTLLPIVNAFSALYAAKAAFLNPVNSFHFVRYITEATHDKSC